MIPLRNAAQVHLMMIWHFRSVWFLRKVSESPHGLSDDLCVSKLLTIHKNYKEKGLCVRLQQTFENAVTHWYEHLVLKFKILFLWPFLQLLKCYKLHGHTHFFMAHILFPFFVPNLITLSHKVIMWSPGTQVLPTAFRF